MREKYIHKQKVGFRPKRGYIDYIFILRQYVEHGNTFHRTITTIFCIFKSASDSVDQEALFHCILAQDVLQK